MAQTKTLFLKPAAGGLVRDPVSRRPLDAEGEEKPDTPFWRRRLRFGEVQEAARPKAPKAASGKSNSKKA